MQIVHSLTYEGASMADADISSYGTSDESLEHRCRYQVLARPGQYWWDVESFIDRRFSHLVGNNLWLFIRGLVQ